MNNIIYLLELRKYNKRELRDLGIGNELIKILHNKALCKSNELSEYYFTFVGTISFKGKVIFILPKYFQECTKSDKSIEHAALVVKVLKKYSKTNISKVYDSDYLNYNLDDSNISELAIADYIISDYIKNGLYTNDEIIDILNGQGDTNWTMTIENVDPVIINNRPYYLDVYTRDYVRLQDDILIKIHSVVLKLCIESYGALLGYRNIYVQNQYSKFDIMSNKEYILSVLKSELQIVYEDRKIRVIKSLYNFVSKQFLDGGNFISIYGSTSFQYVWQESLSTIFNNEYTKYKKYIPKPIWYLENDFYFEAKTLMPDIIKNISSGNEENLLAILDAKYYNIKYSGSKLENYPGVSDVSKQILYEQAIISSGNFGKIFNAFLFPSGNLMHNTFYLAGRVEFDIIKSTPIALVYLCAESVFQMYISNKVADKDLLINIIESFKIDNCAKNDKDKQNYYINEVHLT